MTFLTPSEFDYYKEFIPRNYFFSYMPILEGKDVPECVKIPVGQYYTDENFLYYGYSIYNGDTSKQLAEVTPEWVNSCPNVVIPALCCPPALLEKYSIGEEIKGLRFDYETPFACILPKEMSRCVKIDEDLITCGMMFLVTKND